MKVSKSSSAIPLILLPTGYTITGIKSVSLLVLSFNVCFSYWWNSIYFISIARYEQILLQKQNRNFYWMHLNFLCIWEQLFVKFPSLFWMVKVIFASYRSYIIDKVISNNLKNSSHFLIHMEDGWFFCDFFSVCLGVVFFTQQF